MAECEGAGVGKSRAGMSVRGLERDGARSGQGEIAGTCDDICDRQGETTIDRENPARCGEGDAAIGVIYGKRGGGVESASREGKLLSGETQRVAAEVLLARNPQGTSSDSSAASVGVCPREDEDAGAR